MKNAKAITRILFGLILVVFGLNKFLQFMPMPPMPDEAGAFMGALVNSGYLMVTVAIIEIVTGLFLLANKYQALMLVLVFPVMLNAFLFHLFLDPAGIGGAVLAMGLNIFLMFTQKDKYMELLKA